MTEQGEAPKPYLEIEAPEYLEEGQNLFDQDPFVGACREVQERYSLDESLTRWMLGILVEHRDVYRTSAAAPTPTEGFSEKTVDEQTFTLQQYTNKILAYSTYNLKELPEETVYRSVRVFFRNLINFPYWGEYLGINTNGGEYYRDGKPRGKTKKYVPVESYGKWVSDRLRAEGRRVLWGLDEVFPEAAPTATNPTRRKWQILKTSELTRGKR